jgi:hypothetical protein
MSYIHDRLIADTAIAQVWPGHLDLDRDLLLFKQNVHRVGAPGITGRPLFRPDIDETSKKERS